MTSAVENCDLVIEAIVENIDAKRDLFQKIEPCAPTSCIFATNTSSFQLSDIASVLQIKQRFGGLHFFNPVPVMPLVEVSRMAETSDDTFTTLMNFSRKLDKTPVACKDTPGFIVNRLLVPYLMEAVRMVQRGHASKRDVDLAMKLGAGYKIGPLELLDFIGLDTAKFVIDGWHEKYPDEKLFEPVQLISQLVAQGKLGRKTGEGFYTYSKL